MALFQHSTSRVLPIKLFKNVLEGRVYCAIMSYQVGFIFSVDNCHSNFGCSELLGASFLYRGKYNLSSKFVHESKVNLRVQYRARGKKHCTEGLIIGKVKKH